jgi:tripartite-type tricarboxylate transporter receptor subunit TctC
MDRLACSLPLRRRTLLLAAAAAVAIPARAQNFPAKPIHLVVPYGAGGGLDLIARAVGERAGRMLKQPVIVENRTGANGVIATEAVAKSPGDGYTLVIGVPATIAINPSLYKLSFDPLKDLQAVGQLATAHFVLVTAPGSGIRNVEQLLAQAKAKPGQISFASYGNGSAPHLAGQMLRSLAGVDMVHVPYKGSMAALPDVITGRVTAMFDVVGNVQPHVAAGTLQVLAAAGDRVPPQFPGVPLMKAAVPGFSLDGWVGVFAPASTPAAIVQQLNEATRAALSDPALARRLTEMGFEVVPGTPQQLQDITRRDFATYARAVQAAGLRME